MDRPIPGAWSHTTIALEVADASRIKGEVMILIVEGLAIIRESVAACLRTAGYETVGAADGNDGLAKARTTRPDLILLDMALPGMDGLKFLRELREDPKIAATPVIVLTEAAEKDRVIQAIRLGVREYLLKSRFSVKDLLERVKKHLGKQGASAARNGPPDARAGPHAAPVSNPARTVQSSPNPGRTASANPVATADPPTAIAPSAKPTAAAAQAVDIPKLLDKEECLSRARDAVKAKTLSGVVAQVMALASSPRGEMSQLASFIARDPVLSARVLSTANSAAYSSNKGIVSTIPEAVKRIGFNSIRNIAIAVGIFDVMPESGADGFNPIRCWQHSFAVAQLCEQIEQLQHEESAPLAYVVGLCHELGEMLVRAHFHNECQQIIDMQAQTGKPLEELERRMLGVTRRQISETLTESLGLPDAIRRPINAYHRGVKNPSKDERLAGVLHLANLYANGLLLATGPAEIVDSFTRFGCRSITGIEDPPRPEAELFRANICSLTAMLAKLDREEEAQLMAPLLPPKEVRVWMVRELRPFELRSRANGT